jgi:FMN-dependent NADH-azoreductase
LGKQAINITSRGGKYSEGPFADLEMGDRYLRTIFGFLGITDYQTLSAELLDVIGHDAEAIVGEGILKGQELARTF